MDINSIRNSPTVSAAAGNAPTAAPERSFKSVLRGASEASTALPGAPVMALSIRGTMPAAGATAAAAASGGVGAAGPTAGSSTDGTNMDAALQQSQDQNIQYLQLQQQMNAQDRMFSTLSNVLKSEHDTIKNAIGNIR